MLVIIDYGVGNVQSVTNAFRYIGSDITVSCDPAVIDRAHGLILPGVGASGYAMEKIAPIADVIKSQAATGKPLLGICVGYQLLFEESYEMGTHQCLGLVKGKVIPIPTDMGLTIPHMGWNYVKFDDDMRLFQGLGEGKHFAQMDDPDAKVAYTGYGIQMTGAVEKGNIYGCQFHPEKSAADGLQVLKNFVKICHEEL
jgi:glutamine amidotransferase